MEDHLSLNLTADQFPMCLQKINHIYKQPMVYMFLYYTIPCKSKQADNLLSILKRNR